VFLVPPSGAKAIVAVLALAFADPKARENAKRWRIRYGEWDKKFATPDVKNIRWDMAVANFWFHYQRAKAILKGLDDGDDYKILRRLERAFAYYLSDPHMWAGTGPWRNKEAWETGAPEPTLSGRYGTGLYMLPPHYKTTFFGTVGSLVLTLIKKGDPLDRLETAPLLIAHISTFRPEMAWGFTDALLKNGGSEEEVARTVAMATEFLFSNYYLAGVLADDSQLTGDKFRQFLNFYLAWSQKAGEHGYITPSFATFLLANGFHEDFLGLWEFVPPDRRRQWLQLAIEASEVVPVRGGVASKEFREELKRELMNMAGAGVGVQP